MLAVAVKSCRNEIIINAEWIYNLNAMDLKVYQKDCVVIRNWIHIFENKSQAF